MARFRRRLSFIVAMWLVSQVATIAAAPFARCADHDHGHGQASMPADCAMHHHHQEGAQRDAPAWQCQCQTDDAALAGLILGTGLMPPDVLLTIPLSAGASVEGTITAPSRSDAPDTQPPRA